MIYRSSLSFSSHYFNNFRLYFISKTRSKLAAEIRFRCGVNINANWLKTLSIAADAESVVLNFKNTCFIDGYSFKIVFSFLSSSKYLFISPSILFSIELRRVIGLVEKDIKKSSDSCDEHALVES